MREHNTHLHITLLISFGKITAPWFSGLLFSFSQFVCNVRVSQSCSQVCYIYFSIYIRNLREMFKIDAADYMMSICGGHSLKELSSPGKSGSIFYLSQDERFVIKTLKTSEVKVFFCS